MQKLGESVTPEVAAALKGARRIHNRGLGAAVRVKARALKLDEFRPEDLLPLVRAEFPAADLPAVAAALATLAARQGSGIERVGIGRTGIYRVAGTAPNLEDEDVLDKALGAIADLEALVKRHRAVLVTMRALKKALAGEV